MDQKSGARSSKMTPNVSKLFSPPVISAGPIKRNTPPNPMIKPRMACQVGFDPPARMDSNNTSQKGDVEIIRAAMPEGTLFSAQATSPLPPSNSAVPTIAVDFQFPRVGAGSPAMRLQAYRIAPEIKNLSPACINGGMVSTANRIARYVDPQTIYSASKAIQTFVFIQILLFLSLRGAFFSGNASAVSNLLTMMETASLSLRLRSPIGSLRSRSPGARAGARKGLQ